MRKILIFLSMLLIGCCPCRMTAPSTTSSDSTSVKVVHKIERVLDTVYVEIPKVVEKVVSRDTISYLENEYAYSEAIVEGEFLYHSLATKPQRKPVEVQTKKEYRDSIIERIIEKEVVSTIEVEKPDTWWEQTQKKGFWAMTIALILFVLWRLLKSRIKIL